MADPQPADQWVSTLAQRLPRGHPGWRPFQGPLSPTSRRQAMVILNVMFGWLVSAGYLAGNPLSLSRQRQRKAKPRITRYLDPSLWAEVKQYIDRMPRESDRERAHYHRNRWLFTLLYLGGLRISEVGENTMGAFFCRRDRDGEERWWLEVLGQGRQGSAGAGDQRNDDRAGALPARVRSGALPFTGRRDAARPADRKVTEVDDAGGASQHRQDGVRESGRRTENAGAGVRGSSGATFAGICPLASPHRRIAHGRWRCGSAPCAGQPRARVAEDNEPVSAFRRRRAA